MVDGQSIAGSLPKWRRLRNALNFGRTFWLATALLFVFSLPHVMALRNLLLLALLVLVFRYLGGLREMLKQSDVRMVSVAFIALLAWMLCVTFFMAPEPTASLRAFIGEWARALLALVVGCGVALAMRRESAGQLSSLVISLIFLASFAHVVGHDIAALLKWVESGDLPSHFPGITDHKWNVTHVIALLLSAMGADIAP